MNRETNDGLDDFGNSDNRIGLICWLGQTLVVFAPRVAVKLGVVEPEEDVDRSMYLFERYSQGIIDAVRDLHDRVGYFETRGGWLTFSSKFQYFPASFMIHLWME